MPADAGEMNFESFRQRAESVFAEIPEEFRSGVDGLDILPKIVYHPELEGIYTLGECLTESYPSEFGGAGEIRSRVALYYGSFVQVSKEDEEWDWEEEIYETITHEIRHHLEHLASDETLEEMDYAEDQNFARLDGTEFEPFFYRSGEPLGAGSYRVGTELFIEVQVTDPKSGQLVEVSAEEVRFSFTAPAALADVHFVEIPEECSGSSRPVTVVLLRRQGFWRSLRSAIGTQPLEVASSEAEGCVGLGGDAAG